jgi:hypothetical protein
MMKTRLRVEKNNRMKVILGVFFKLFQLPFGRVFMDDEKIKAMRSSKWRRKKREKKLG